MGLEDFFSVIMGTFGNFFCQKEGTAKGTDDETRWCQPRE